MGKIVATFACVAALALPAGAQGVRLELRPHGGDTLHMRLEQNLEVVARSRVKERDSTVIMRRSTTLHSRSVVQSVDPKGATIAAFADSMSITEGGATRSRKLRARVLMHLAPDGMTRVLDDGGVLAGDAAALIRQMPATLPDHPIEVGARWTHTAAMPIPGQPEGIGAGEVTTTFRLDSLSSYGDVAYISLRGKLARPDGGVMLPNGVRFESSGSMVGSVQVDRRRGWLTALRATITVESVLTASGMPPVRVRTRVEQVVSTMDPVDKP